MTEEEREQALGALQAELGHTFGDRGLLDEALTHSSYANEHDVRDNERLEFLGDSVVNTGTTALLMDRFPDAPEGELTRLRQQLVNTDTLGALGRSVGLGDLLRMGRGEEQSGGRERTAVLADATEAVVGALFREAGFEPCVAVLRRWLEPHVRRLEERAEAEGRAAWQNPRGRLQELTQARWRQTPDYALLATDGPPHEPTFRAAVRIGDRVLGEGCGRSKQEAFRLAAEQALQALREEP